MRSVLFALQRNKHFLMIGRIEVEVSYFSINLAVKFFVGQNTKKTLANQLGILQSSGLPQRKKMTLEFQSFTTSVFGIFFWWCKDKDLAAFLEDGAKILLAIADIFPQNLKKMVHLDLMDIPSSKWLLFKQQWPVDPAIFSKGVYKGFI